MSLAPGTRLGVYDITAPLGEGGMGQVWRATDSTLGRQVAIKILPDAFATDPERLARFEREAKTLASLNHPHIAAIYGFEKSSNTHALVMELVEGEDLSQRLARGAIPLDEALPIAKQIAQALEAAHEQGIVHRDLKPANIKVREDGTVKVLDFGLAKALQDPTTSGPQDLLNSPTITSPAMTMQGVILGTAAYMSPEQAKGRAVDKRSDVWAFGAVLFEMLTGRRAFSADDVAETLAAVLMKEPDWTALPATVPPAVRTVLQRCMHKDRKQRVRDIGDVALALDGAFEMAGLQSHPSAAAVLPRGRAVQVTAASLLTAVLVGGAMWGLGSAPQPAPVVARFAIASPDGRLQRAIAISPDGTRMAFTETDSAGIYLRTIGDVEAHLVAGIPPGITPLLPTFSPDGESLAFYSTADNSLKRIPVTGGQPLTLAQGLRNPTGLTWDQTGIVYSQGPSGVFRVSANGGNPELLVSAGSGESLRTPQLLPGGKSVLFTVAPLGTQDADVSNTASVVVQLLGSGERRTIVRGASDGKYLETGHVIYLSAGTLYAVTFDPDSNVVGGNPVALLPGVRRSPGDVAALLSISNTGSLFFVPGPSDGASVAPLLPLLATRDGQPIRLAAAPGAYRRPRVSPDGKRFAVAIDDGSAAEVWIQDIAATSAMRRLTFGGRNRFPVWSPDGRRIAFQSDRDGSSSIYVQSADGDGGAERLTTAPAAVSHIPESWSPDGRTLLFSERKDDNHALMALSTSDRRAAPFGGVQSLQPIEAAFSPDGRWVAYASTLVAGGTSSPDRGIFVQPFPATGAAYQVPKTRLDFHPAWAPNGREIFYVPTVVREELMAVSVQFQPTLIFGPPTAMAGVRQPGFTSEQFRGYDVLPDGRVLTLMDADSASGTRAEMRLVLNWFEELKRLVPVRE